MDLLASMRVMHHLLRGERTAKETAAALGAPEDRLLAYQRFVRAHVQAVLDKNYPTLRVVLGEELWARLSASYFVAVPPTDPELNRAVAHFPSFLEEQARNGAAGLQLFHAELAELEWQELEVYLDPAVIPAPAPDRAPAINPTLRVLQLRYPAGAFLLAFRAFEAGRRPDPPEAPGQKEEPEAVLVFRHPADHDYRFVIADAGLLFALKVVEEQLAPLQAAEQAGVSEAVVGGVLRRALELGIVV